MPKQRGSALAHRQPPAEILVAILAAILAAGGAPGLAVVGLVWLAGLRGYAAAKHRRWWLFLAPERSWMPWSALAGVTVVFTAAAWSLVLVRDGRFDALAGPLVLSVLAGVAAAPGVFVMARRMLRQQVLEGRTDDVLATAQVADAVRRADDELTARSVGVSLHEHTVEVRVADPERRKIAPVPVEVGASIRYGIGVLMPEDRLTDFERSAHFTSPDSDLLLVPRRAGQIRALIIAGSGTGKTELIAGFHAVANRSGMTSVLIDLKGQAADAERFGRDARDQRHYLGADADVRVERGGWDFFDCDRDQLLERLMFIAPKTTSTDFYRQQMHRVLDIVIDGRGTKPLVRSLDELAQRLDNPARHLGRQLAGPISTPDRHGRTEAMDVAQKVDAMFAPLREYLPKTGAGWSFSKLPPGSATIVSLSPVLHSERMLANLMLRDLRDFLVARARSVVDPAKAQPLLVIVDEYSQMVEEDTDAAEEAVKILEVARAGEVGLILASQTIEGYSANTQLQRRVLGAGVAVILGRSALPETVTDVGGTRWQLDPVGDLHGYSFNSARTQTVDAVPAQYVRRMHTGTFWLLHEGAAARFLAFQTR